MPIPKDLPEGIRQSDTTVDYRTPITLYHLYYAAQRDFPRDHPDSMEVAAISRGFIQVTAHPRK